jgi:hypothetical protein
MIETIRYVRKPLYVDAVQVTEENFEELSVWCQGTISRLDSEPMHRKEDNALIIEPRKMCINVRVNSPKSIRQTQAQVGDWLLYTDRGYKVYTPQAFESTFSRVD